MTRNEMLSDAVWARIEPVLPPLQGRMGRPTRGHRLLVEAAIWRYRTGSPWRDLPAEFGPWRTAWKRHARFAEDPPCETDDRARRDATEELRGGAVAVPLTRRQQMPA